MKIKELLEILLYKKTDKVILQLFRYGIVGGLAACVDIGSFSFFFYALSIDYRVAVFLSFTLGTLTNFLISNVFVFDRKSLTVWRACARHYIASLGGLATNEVVMIALVEYFSFSNMFIAKIIATASAFFVNFTLMRMYAFNQNISISKTIKSIKREKQGVDL